LIHHHNGEQTPSSPRQVQIAFRSRKFAASVLSARTIHHSAFDNRKSAYRIGNGIAHGQLANLTVSETVSESGKK
jgi:hypothetical protein